MTHKIVREKKKKEDYSIFVVFEPIMSQQKRAHLEWEVTGCHWSKVNGDETEDGG